MGAEPRTPAPPCPRGAAGSKAAPALEPLTRSRSPARCVPLCRTAFAGLFPARDSLERCWWLSARHSTSARRAFNAMAG